MHEYLAALNPEERQTLTRMEDEFRQEHGKAVGLLAFMVPNQEGAL